MAVGMVAALIAIRAGHAARGRSWAGVCARTDAHAAVNSQLRKLSLTRSQISLSSNNLQLASFLRKSLSRRLKCHAEFDVR